MGVSLKVITLFRFGDPGFSDDLMSHYHPGTRFLRFVPLDSSMRTVKDDTKPRPAKRYRKRGHINNSFDSAEFSWYWHPRLCHGAQQGEAGASQGRYHQEVTGAHWKQIDCWVSPKYEDCFFTGCKREVNLWGCFNFYEWWTEAAINIYVECSFDWILSSIL